MTAIKSLTLLYSKTPSGNFVGKLAEMPEVMSQGKSIDDLTDNIIDAMNCFLDYKKTITEEHSHSIITRSAADGVSVKKLAYAAC